MNLTQRDKNLIWHPFTQAKIAPDVVAINKAQGCYVFDENNKKYLDLISSWWVNIHGHSHPKIAEAIFEQAKKLEHIIFAGFTHEPAVLLCEKIKALLPKQFNKFFFSDNGSTAIEVALKMAYQYWRNIEQKQRTMFLSFKGGYHGDTFGAMSVGAQSGFHTPFEQLFFKVLTLDYPEYWKGDNNIAQKEQNSLEQLDNHLQQYGSEIAALILEPLVQGASGMRMCREGFLKKVIEKVKEYNILVIFDEVMTGFGRLGTNFAFEQLDIVPDFLCVSKGITGGFLPLALTITQQYIYEAFLGDDLSNAFLHGHSYTANPIACSAAIASLNLLQTTQCLEAIDNINRIHNQELKNLMQNCAIVEKPRIKGTIAAFNIKENTISITELRAKFFENGLILRPLGNNVYILPPYCITEIELKEAYAKIQKILNS